MLIVIIGLLVLASVTLIVVGITSRAAAPSIEARITDFRTRTYLLEPDEVDLEMPFYDRIVRPTLESLARGFSSVLPQSVLASIQKQLTMAGNPMSLNAYMTFWLSILVLFGLLAVMAFVTMPGAIFQKAGIAMLLLLLAWALPRTWLSGKVKRRQKQVIRALPDAIDLITTCVEAGLGLDAALARVAEKTEGPFAEELQRMLRDIAMGKLRRDALLELQERVAVEELTSFISSVVQAEQLGVGIAQVLRVQSDQMRTRRRQRAERAAHEAPIKMLFPLVFFIFPAFLIVILGPAVIRIADSF
jgi:tight adherence protein C